MSDMPMEQNRGTPLTPDQIAAMGLEHEPILSMSNPYSWTRRVPEHSFGPEFTQTLRTAWAWLDSGRVVGFAIVRTPEGGFTFVWDGLDGSNSRQEHHAGSYGEVVAHMSTTGHVTIF